MPSRVQRKRSAGWQKPPNTVCVDRTSRWGNPFTAASDAAYFGVTLDDARALVTDRFHLWLADEIPGDRDAYQVARARPARPLSRRHPAQPRRQGGMPCLNPAASAPCRCGAPGRR